MKIRETTNVFIDQISYTLSPKTIKKYEYVLELFLDYLANYTDLPHEENKDGSIFVTADTAELHDAQVETFLEWFLIRKVIGPEWITTSAPGIMKKYIKWLHTKGLLADGVMNDLIGVTKKASKDLPRVQKAAELLYHLCLMNAARFKIDALNDDAYKEGYGDVLSVEEDRLSLDLEGEKIGPVLISRDIARHLKIGDSINIVVGRKGKTWYPLDVGNVYPGR